MKSEDSIVLQESTCVSKEKGFCEKRPKTAHEGNAVPRTKVKSSKQTPRRFLSVSLYHLSPVFPLPKVLLSS